MRYILARNRRRRSRKVRSVTEYPETPRAVPAPPVAGMVGAGQLARMTSQAATGLGVGFRILAGAADESAAQVVAGRQLGDYRSLADLRGFAAGCDVVTFDHEHVPGEHLAVLEQDGVQRPARARRAALHARTSWPCASGWPGWASPARGTRRCRTLAEVEAFAGGGWPVVLKAVSGGYDGKGVWVCESAAEAAEVAARTASTCWPRSTSPSSASWPCSSARSPHRQGAVYPVVQTVQRDGICREVIAPAPGLAPGRAAAGRSSSRCGSPPSSA